MLRTRWTRDAADSSPRDCHCEQTDVFLRRDGDHPELKISVFRVNRCVNCNLSAALMTIPKTNSLITDFGMFACNVATRLTSANCTSHTYLHMCQLRNQTVVKVLVQWCRLIMHRPIGAYQPVGCKRRICQSVCSCASVDQNEVQWLFIAC